MIAWRIVALVALGAVACERRPAPPCTAGASVACTCIGSLTGTQTCQADGTLSVCLCAPPATARVEAEEVPTPITLPAAAAAEPPPPSSLPTAPVAEPAGATPMEQARVCLRSNSNNMAAGNACVVQVLRGRASSESEFGLLGVTYRTMGRTSDAVRVMRAYIQRFPDGPRVTGFQQYIDNHSG